MKKQAVEDETKAHNTIDTAGIISSVDKAKISEIASDVRIRGEYDEEKEGIYLADYNSMQDDPYNEEEIVEFIEEHDEWASTGERPRQSGGFGYLQEPVTERECDYWTERDLTIENIESVAEGDHEDQAIDNIGMTCIVSYCKINSTTCTKISIVRNIGIICSTTFQES